MKEDSIKSKVKIDVGLQGNGDESDTGSEFCYKCHGLTIYRSAMLRGGLTPVCFGLVQGERVSKPDEVDMKTRKIPNVNESNFVFVRVGTSLIRHPKYHEVPACGSRWKLFEYMASQNILPAQERELSHQHEKDVLMMLEDEKTFEDEKKLTEEEGTLISSEKEFVHYCSGFSMHGSSWAKNLRSPWCLGVVYGGLINQRAVYSRKRTKVPMVDHQNYWVFGLGRVLIRDPIHQEFPIPVGALLKATFIQQEIDEHTLDVHKKATEKKEKEEVGQEQRQPRRSLTEFVGPKPFLRGAQAIQNYWVSSSNGFFIRYINLVQRTMSQCGKTFDLAVKKSHQAVHDLIDDMSSPKD